MLGIINGEVYDPQNGINGEIRDIWIKDGKIVSADEVERAEAEIIDATGLVVMPGGVDIHSHIVGAKVNAGRKFRPEDHRDHVRTRTTLTRSGSGYTVPTTYMTGYMYAEMGYTTVMEAATAPLVARHTHEELEDTPILDKGVFITMGNNHFIMDCIRKGEREKARDYVAWLLGASKGYAIKIVNPGGVENWKWGRNVEEVDDEVIGFGVTPRQIVSTLAWINDELKLPHVPHIHAINLGQVGNARTTVEMMEALEGRRAHFCHLQFLSYGGKPGKRLRSGAAEVARAVNEHPNITVDVGQVIFGPATTMTSDGPLQYRLHQLTGDKWLNDDVEGETGGGVVPMQYKRKNPFNAVQWLIGLELFLLIDDPWRVYLTTDHPNAGPFFRYPQVIKLLMDRDYRAEVCEGLHPRAKKGALLPELDREYSLYEIAIITRAGTARALGLKNKGHLGVGADADVTIYAKLDDKEEMFARPHYVLKGGEVVVRDGQLVRELPGRTLYVAPPYDPGIERDLRAHFEECYTISFDNYPVAPEYLPHGEVVPCS
ncbi:MAG: formylmethanofuran dehydrogenase subunit A [Anaerolineae bacterium]|jgi:formylmethanofuran dehydrogenase subunit A|nr:formylmethanofuran dehydrogenase subunit A [Anaerolineae bacterium]MDH7474340.1 formylmethanofuran dehydrogenase subunit A [Anaerolineae bacterium]